MRVVIEFFATLRDKYGRRIDLNLNVNEPVSVREVLSHVEGLLDEITENGRLKEMYKVLVNGLNIEFLKGLDTEVNDGDEICVFPPAGGG